METRVNRAEVLLENWREQEQRLAKFGEHNGSTYRELLRQRYIFLRAGVWRLGMDVRPNEKANLQLLKGALARMERQLRSNVVLRLWARLRAAVLERPKMIKEFRAMKEDNLLELKRFLSDRGFGVLVAGLERELDFERNWFAMRMSAALDGGARIEMELEMARDLNGRYHPTLIDATLVGADGTSRNHGFPLGDPLDAGMVVNLMQGRAVCVGERDAHGEVSEKWLQIHFEHADSYPRNFYPDYGFDAGRLLGDFARQTGIAGLDDVRLLDGLKKGNQVAFDGGAAFGGKLLLEADPSARQLAVLDGDGKRISLVELLERKRAHEAGLGRERANGREVELRPKRTRAKGKGLEL